MYAEGVERRETKGGYTAGFDLATRSVDIMRAQPSKVGKYGGSGVDPLNIWASMEHDWNTIGRCGGELKQSEKAESAMKLHGHPVIMTSIHLFVRVLCIVLSISIASSASHHLPPLFMQRIIRIVLYRSLRPIITLPLNANRTNADSATSIPGAREGS